MWGCVCGYIYHKAYMIDSIAFMDSKYHRCLEGRKSFLVGLTRGGPSRKVCLDLGFE